MTTVKLDHEGLGQLEGLDAKSGRPARGPAPAAADASSQRLTWMQRLEAWISRLSTRNRFWQKVCSLIWLPYAFRSGITMKQLDAKRFTAVLPFRRFNRNWYNAMAGAALLGNSEVAGGMYLFQRVGSDFIVVCKEMKYRFLRPCVGPAVYHIIDSEDLDAKLHSGGEFNIKLVMDIRQQVRRHGREPRVGKCEITFHCVPKQMMRERTEARELRGRAREEGAGESSSSALARATPTASPATPASASSEASPD